MAFMRAALCAALLGLGACGGGGGSPPAAPPPPPPANRAPISNPGVAQNILTGAMVTLDGQSSFDPDSNPLTFVWTMTSRPVRSVAVITNPYSARASFRADVSGTYEFSLTVTDGSLTSSATTSVTATTSAADLNTALVANPGVLIEPDNRMIQLEWNDLPNMISYRIEVLKRDFEYHAVETVAALSSSGRRAWRRPHTGEVYRVVALNNEGREIRLARSAVSEDITTFYSQPFRIEIDKAEPLSGQIELSLTPAQATGSTVQWFLDGYLLPVTPVGGSSKAFNWTIAGAAGPHLLEARVDLGLGQRGVFRRRVEFATGAGLNGTYWSAEQRGRSLLVHASPGSNIPITRMDLIIPGGATRTLTVRNSCGLLDCVDGIKTHFTFDLDVFEAGLPANGATLSYTDNMGITLPTSINLGFARRDPVLDLLPRAGAFVANTLAFSGSAATSTGPTAAMAWLGTQMVLDSPGSPFATNVDLAGRALGSHSLQLVGGASNTMRSFIERKIVATTPALLPTLLFSTDESAGIVAAEGDLILYRMPNESLFVYNAFSNTHTMLRPLPGQVGDIVISSGRVFSAGRNSADCPASDICIYQWDATTGQFSNLSSLDPGYGPPGARNVRTGLRNLGNAQIVWYNASTVVVPYFTIYHSSTTQFTAVATPNSEVEYEFDAALDGNGQPTLAYFGSLNFNANSPIGVYVWKPGAAPVHVGTLPDGSTRLQVSTDGAFVGYTYRANSPGDFGTHLIRTAVTGGPATDLSSNARIIGFRNGILAWRESGHVSIIGTRIHTAAGGAVTLSDKFCADTGFQMANGYFAWCTLDSVNVFNAATGTSTLRAHGGPQVLFFTQAGAWIHFKSGEGVYRVSVN